MDLRGRRGPGQAAKQQGEDCPPKPPALGSAPAQPWRSSISREESPKLPMAARNALLARANEGPGRVGERARPPAALLRVRIVRGARDHAPHDALRDRGQPEHGEREAELPVGDRGASRTLAVGRDVVLLGRDAQRRQILVRQPLPLTREAVRQAVVRQRSEEHTSELQSLAYL